MFVLTADQVKSRDRTPLATATIDAVTARYARALPLPVEQSSGDELQAVTPDPDAALGIALLLTRDGAWRVGLGIGSVDPLGTSVRSSTGDAFVAARDGVNAAKSERRLLVVRAEPDGDDARDLDALCGLLVTLRSARTPAGREIVDLVDALGTQSAAAEQLGISAAAASDRARRAGLKAELAARGALVRGLSALDRSRAVDVVGRV